MSDAPPDLPAALRFLRVTRDDPVLAQRVRTLAPEEGLGPLLELAAEAGFELTAEGLRAAHRIDWQLRRARYA